MGLIFNTPSILIDLAKENLCPERHGWNSEIRTWRFISNQQSVLIGFVKENYALRDVVGIVKSGLGDSCSISHRF